MLWKLRFNLFQETPNTLIDLFNHITIDTKRGPTVKIRMGFDREMRRRQRKIEQKRCVGLLVNKEFGFREELLGEKAVIKGILHHLIAAPNLSGLVVALIQVIGVLESLLVRAEGGRIAQVPFPDQCGLVTGFLEHFGKDRDRG